MDNSEKCNECGCTLTGIEEVCPKCGCLILKENTINVTLKTRKEMIQDIKKKILTKKNIMIACGAIFVIALIITIIVKVCYVNDKMFTKVQLGMSIAEVKEVISGQNTTSIDLKNMVLILTYDNSDIIGINGKAEYVFKDDGSYLYQIKFIFPYESKDIDKMREYLDDEYGNGSDEGRLYKYNSDSIDYEFTNGETVTDQVVTITMK